MSKRLLSATSGGVSIVSLTTVIRAFVGISSTSLTLFFFIKETVT